MSNPLPEMLSNTGLVRATVSAMGLGFSEHVIPDFDGGPIGIDVTTVAFANNPEDPERWRVIVFSESAKAKLCIYAHIREAVSDSDAPRILQAVNYINYKYMYDSNYEYAPDTQSVRFKQFYEIPFSGLPVIETQERIAKAISRANYARDVFIILMRSDKPVPEAVEAARAEIRKDGGLEFDPQF
jgi:hypothetical protein